MQRCALAAIIFIAFQIFSMGIAAQDANVGTQSQAAAEAESVSERLRRMEAQIVVLQAEIERLKRTPAPGTAPGEPSTPPAKSTAASPAAEPASNSTVSTSAAKKQTVDTSGVQVKPYGTIYFNAFNNSKAVNNQDVPLFATPSGLGGVGATVRQTRLGLRVEGARFGTAKLSGVIEADFYGGIPTSGIGENFGVVRVRLANARLDWEKTSLTIGQDWMPFAPVNPTSLAAAAIPQMAAAGNNWARIPQVRVDQKLTSNITATVAVLAPQSGDYPTASNFFIQPGSGAASRTPYFQSRIAYADKNWFSTKKVGSVGFSAHYGRSRVVNDREDIDSYGLALDWSFPLHKRVSLAGEAFVGRALAGFQAGVFQGINTEFAFRSGNLVTPAGSRGINTKGGWTQIGFTPDVFGDRWSIFASVGIDDPRDADLTSVSRFNFRTRNLAYAVNTIFKLTPQFSLGAEVRRFETSYFNTGKSTSEHFNLGASYSF